MTRRERIAGWCIAACVAIAVFAVGGAPRWTVPLLGLASLLAAAMFIGSSRQFKRVPPLLSFLALGAGLTLLQLVPLPALVTQALSPMAYELVADAAITAGQPVPSWIALSLDPPGTIVELGKLAAYLTFAFACLRVATSSAGRVRLIQTVAVAGTTAAVVAQVHHLAGATTLYGLYTPERATPYLAPLLNPNHFATLMVITACLTLGLAVRARGRLRLAWLAAGGLAIATCLFTRSRGAVIALAVGIGMAGAIIAWNRFRPLRKDRRATIAESLPAVVIAGCALTLIIAFSASGVAAELAGIGAKDVEAPGGKVAAWQASAVLLHDHKWTGVGRGAFEPAFARVHAPTDDKVYSHVENEYLQAAIDWGILGAAGLAAALIWALLPAVRRLRDSPVRTGSAAAVVAVGLQSVVDFGLELPGIAVPMCVLLSQLGHVPVGGKAGPRHRRLRVAGIAAGGLCLLAVALPWATTVRETRATVAHRLDAASTPKRAIAIGVEEMRRHPADYFVPTATALRLFELGDGRAALFANHALRLRPTQPQLHWLVARILVAARREGQACIEWKLAIQYSDHPQAVLREVIASYPDRVKMLDCLPIEQMTRPELLVDELIAAKEPGVALQVARTARAHHADRVPLLHRIGQLEQEAGDLPAATNALDQAERLAPTTDGAHLLAKLHVARNELDRAEKMTLEAVRRTSSEGEKVRLLTWLADVFVARTQFRDARRVLTMALGVAGVRPALRAGIHRRLAGVERALGNDHRALWEEGKARELTRP